MGFIDFSKQLGRKDITKLLKMFSAVYKKELEVLELAARPKSTRKKEKKDSLREPTIVICRAVTILLGTLKVYKC